MNNDVTRKLIQSPVRPAVAPYDFNDWSLIRISSSGFGHFSPWPKRLPDRSEPWASEIRQANLLHLLPKIMCDALIYCFEQGSQIERVRRQIILMLRRSLRLSL
jgi:hypothetical protein